MLTTMFTISPEDKQALEENASAKPPKLETQIGV